jgi:hypothetical protein
MKKSINYHLPNKTAGLAVEVVLHSSFYLQNVLKNPIIKVTKNFFLIFQTISSLPNSYGGTPDLYQNVTASSTYQQPTPTFERNVVLPTYEDVQRQEQFSRQQPSSSSTLQQQQQQANLYPQV